MYQWIQVTLLACRGFISEISSIGNQRLMFSGKVWRDVSVSGLMLEFAIVTVHLTHKRTMVGIVTKVHFLTITSFWKGRPFKLTLLLSHWWLLCRNILFLNDSNSSLSLTLWLHRHYCMQTEANVEREMQGMMKYQERPATATFVRRFWLTTQLNGCTAIGTDSHAISFSNKLEGDLEECKASKAWTSWFDVLASQGE